MDINHLNAEGINGMSDQEIFNKLKEIILDKFDIDPDKVTQDMNFKQDLDADSIDMVEFVLELEDAFDIEISDDDASDNINTIAEAIKYIDENSKAQK